VKLPPNQARFVEEYLKDLNGKQAAIRAGYAEKSAEVQASQLLRKPKVRQAVDEALARRSARVEISQDDVLRELLRLATVDIGKAFDANGDMLPLKEMPEDVRRAISSVEVETHFAGDGDERFEVGRLKKVKFWDKKGSLDSLAKHLGMYVEKHQHELGPSLEQLILSVKKAGK
jgi:phage terminase small subunit